MLGFILTQISLSEIRFVSCPNNSAIGQNMGGCLNRPEMVAGVVRLDLVYHDKKGGCGNMHLAQILISK